MSVWGNVIMALRGISSNWLRSLLTMLGVLIGVAAVIVLLAVGTGSSQAVESQIDKLGTNTLTVFSSGRFGGGTSQTGTQSRNATLTSTDVTLISDKNSAPDVASVSPVISTSETSTYNGATYSTSVVGSTPSYLPPRTTRSRLGALLPTLMWPITPKSWTLALMWPATSLLPDPTLWGNRSKLVPLSSMSSESWPQKEAAVCRIRMRLPSPRTPPCRIN